jgi:hypothetical protein
MSDLQLCTSEEVLPCPVAVLNSELYYPLNHQQQEIRLLFIIPVPPGSETDPIVCHLQRVKLKDSGDKVQYIALSYAWGDPNVTLPITVNGKIMQITKSLEAGLRHLRGKGLYGPQSLFWIDAVCINQGDIGERSHQVRMMTQIYTEASFVMVWLGESDEISDQAMDIIEEYHVLTGLMDEIETGGRQNFDDKDFGLLSKGLTEAKSFDILEQFFERPWWSRIWTFQELLLGQSVSILCGLRLLPWDTVLSWVLAIDYLREISIMLPTEIKDQLLLRQHHFPLVHIRATTRGLFREARAQNHHMLSLLPLLQVTRHHQATNPIDYIYGLFGVAMDAVDFQEPNYSLSVAEVYTQIVLNWIRRDNNLKFLEGFSMSRQIEPGSLGLPSWVPNWSRTQRPSFTLAPHDVYSAAKDTKASLRISAETPVCLYINGLIRGTVSYIEPAVVLALTRMEPKRTPIFLRSWAFDDTAFSPTVIPSLQQYFRTLMFDFDLVTKKRLTPNKKSFFDLLSGFVMFLWTLRSDLEYSAHLSNLMSVIITPSREVESPTDNFPLSLAFFGMSNNTAAVDWCLEHILRLGMKWFRQLLERLRGDGMVFFLTEKDCM